MSVLCKLLSWNINHHVELQYTIWYLLLFSFLFKRGRGNQHSWLTSKTLVSIFEKHYSVWGEHSRPQTCNLSLVTNIGTFGGKSPADSGTQCFRERSYFIDIFNSIIVALNTNTWSNYYNSDQVHVFQYILFLKTGGSLD